MRPGPAWEGPTAGLALPPTTTTGSCCCWGVGPRWLVVWIATD